MDSDLPPPNDAPSIHPAVWALLGLSLAGYAGLSVYSNSTPDNKFLGAALSIGPIALIALVLVWRWARAPLAILTTAAAATLLYRYWGIFERHYEWADVVQQCGAYTLVAISFGRTLYAGRVPMCVQLDARIHDTVTAEETAYLRRATAVWTLFYSLLAVLVGVLFATLPLHAWSMFVNVYAFGLIALMCVADYALRRRLLPAHRSGGVWQLLRRMLLG